MFSAENRQFARQTGEIKRPNCNHLACRKSYQIGDFEFG